MLLGVLLVLMGFLLYGGIVVAVAFVIYYIISTAKTLKENSKKQTQLLEEIKESLQKGDDRGREENQEALQASEKGQDGQNR